jgi:polyribonucleotide nucleotidyltransferase
MVAKMSVSKMKWTKTEIGAELTATVKKLAEGKITEAINQKDKHARIESVEKAK